MLLKLAIRNIFRNRRRSLLTIAMMMSGFILVSFTLALLDGSYGTMISLFTEQNTGHVQIIHRDYADNPSLYKTIPNYKSHLLNLQKDQNIKAVTARIYSGALAFYKKKTLGVEVVGIDALAEDVASHYTQRIMQGEDFSGISAYEVMVGKSVAKILKLALGDELILISQAADGSIANDLFTVKAIIGTEQEGKDDYRVYLPLLSAIEYYSLYNQVHEIIIHLNDIQLAGDYAQSLKMPESLISRSWQEVEVEFYRAMLMDQEGNKVTLFIIMLMVGVSVLNTILMSTLERTKEFGVLKAIGTLPGKIFHLIILEGVALSVVSIIFGTLLSLALNYYVSQNGIKLSEPINFAGLQFSEYKTDVSYASIIYPCFIILFTTIIASLYPAIKASRIGVAQALREN